MKYSKEMKLLLFNLFFVVNGEDSPLEKLQKFQAAQKYYLIVIRPLKRLGMSTRDTTELFSGLVKVAKQKQLRRPKLRFSMQNNPKMCFSTNLHSSMMKHFKMSTRMVWLSFQAWLRCVSIHSMNFTHCTDNIGHTYNKYVSQHMQDFTTCYVSKCVRT